MHIFVCVSVCVIFNVVLSFFVSRYKVSLTWDSKSTEFKNKEEAAGW